MGLFDFLKTLFSSRDNVRQPDLTAPTGGLLPEELARRLGLSLDELEQVSVDYHTFNIPKRTGGQRTITAPNRSLKLIQKRILKRLLNRLSCHGCATGFEKGHSIVTNAIPHTGSDTVVKMDIIAFFNTISADRVRAYLYGIGWSKEATDILIRLCTHNGHLPQGAPTSPRLSNLVNIEMDARLVGLATRCGAVYTRYADDMTFSFNEPDNQSSLNKEEQAPQTLADCNSGLQVRDLINILIRMTKIILHEYGYELHNKRKLNIRRKHQQQCVCGLVVNEKVDLPRKTRRRLRAIRHHIETDRPATLTAQQLAGWDAFEQMIRTQTTSSQ